ncbi:MAG: TetR/AcrR family transcriptional regulator [Actinobacteria bacterium]|nr:TetR/AcrR family transcriptional regulator [Actinomycetota bacterium]
MTTKNSSKRAKSKLDSDTRSRLIEVALNTILESGVAAVRIDDIASAVNVTKGSLYWHFEDREALIRAALGEHLRRLSADTVAGISNAVATAKSREDYLALIAPLLSNPFDPNQVNDRWSKLELIVQARKDPLLAELMHDLQVRTLNVFLELMIAAQEEGILRKDIEPRAVAAAISAMNLGSNVFDVLGPDAPSAEAWWGLLLHMIGSLFPEEER